MNEQLLLQVPYNEKLRRGSSLKKRSVRGIAADKIRQHALTAVQTVSCRTMQVSYTDGGLTRAFEHINPYNEELAMLTLDRKWPNRAGLDNVERLAGSNCACRASLE